MTDTIRERAIAAVVTTLGGVSKPSGLTVYRFPLSATQMSELPAMAVYANREEVTRFNGAGPIEKRRLTIYVECRAKVPVGSSADKVLDPYVNWVTESLQADRRLGGLVHDVIEAACRWDVEAGDESVAVAYVELTVEYQTVRTTQTRST